jgi:hypothetical protein
MGVDQPFLGLPPPRRGEEGLAYRVTHRRPEIRRPLGIPLGWTAFGIENGSRLYIHI